jgi:hypothetical protein
MKGIVEFDIPDALVEPWLLVIRFFDKVYPGCRFFTTINAGDLTTAQAKEMLERVGMPNITIAKLQ